VAKQGQERGLFSFDAVKQETEIPAALYAGENDALSRPCRATLAAQAGERKANAFTGSKLHDQDHEQVLRACS
jgi:hypothetical protein